MGNPMTPIASRTVTINGSHYPATSAIWAGLFLAEAELRQDCLAVPWCHVEDTRPDGDCMYRLRPKDERARFVRAVNGAWVLEVGV